MSRTRDMAPHNELARTLLTRSMAHRAYLCLYSVTANKTRVLIPFTHSSGALHTSSVCAHNSAHKNDPPSPVARWAHPRFPTGLEFSSFPGAPLDLSQATILSLSHTRAYTLAYSQSHPSNRDSRRRGRRRRRHGWPVGHGGSVWPQAQLRVSCHKAVAVAISCACHQEAPRRRRCV